MNRQSSSYLEYANLNPAATADEIRRLCDLAEQESAAAVLVLPYWVRLAHTRLKGNNKETIVQVATFLSYPHGDDVASVKGLAARLAVGDGAKDIGIVLNLAVIGAADKDPVRQELAYTIKQAKQAADEPDDIAITVLFESHYLSAAGLQEAINFVAQAGADYLLLTTNLSQPQPPTPPLALGKLKLKAVGEQQSAATLHQAGASRVIVSRS